MQKKNINPQADNRYYHEAYETALRKIRGKFFGYTYTYLVVHFGADHFERDFNSKHGDHAKKERTTFSRRMW
jgi:hypothetical protein